MITLICILWLISGVILTTIIMSLEFRRAYLRQKCINRMTSEEIKEMNKTDQDFWSFLK